MILTYVAPQGIFSEIDLEGDAQSELQQTEWLQSNKTGDRLQLHQTACVVCSCLALSWI